MDALKSKRFRSRDKRCYIKEALTVRDFDPSDFENVYDFDEAFSEKAAFFEEENT